MSCRGQCDRSYQRSDGLVPCVKSSWDELLGLRQSESSIPVSPAPIVRSFRTTRSTRASAKPRSREIRVDQVRTRSTPQSPAPQSPGWSRTIIPSSRTGVVPLETRDGNRRPDTPKRPHVRAGKWEESIFGNQSADVVSPPRPPSYGVVGLYGGFGRFDNFVDHQSSTSSITECGTAI